MVDETQSVPSRYYDFSEKLSSIERKMNSVFDQLKIVEQDSIEKHKEVLKQLETAKDEVSSFEKKLGELNDNIDRLNERFGEFASKEKVKVLEKYINLWDPIKFVTRQEVESLLEQTKGNVVSTVQKRSRGRPRKNKVATGPKRPRGRPRKTR